MQKLEAQKNKNEMDRGMQNWKIKILEDQEIKDRKMKNQEIWRVEQ